MSTLGWKTDELMNYRFLPLTLVALIAFLGLSGCARSNGGITKDEFTAAGSKATTEAEAEAVLGEATEVSDDYTLAIKTVHKLPENTRFLRWPNRDSSKVFHYVAIVDGRIVEWNTRVDE